jgi:hypothetical protein
MTYMYGTVAVGLGKTWEARGKNGDPKGGTMAYLVESILLGLNTIILGHVSQLRTRYVGYSEISGAQLDERVQRLH